MAQTPYVTQNGMVVDPARIKRNGETLLFTPFQVEHTQRLADVWDNGTLPDDEQLLIAPRGDHVIALSRRQMAYHHVAQGTYQDQPWLVFF